jgi:hypothetical protein
MALVLFAVGELGIPPDDQCQIGIAERIFQEYATDNKLALKYWNYLFFCSCSEANEGWHEVCF